MRQVRRAAIGLLVLLATLVASAGVSAEPTLSAEAWMKLQAARVVRAGKTVDYARNHLLRKFRQADYDGGGVSRTDYLLRDQINAARGRSSQISRWLAMDLDGDGRVTRAELQAFHGRRARQPLRSQGIELDPTPEQVELTLRKLVDKSLRIDRDRDQVITFAEMLAAENEALRKRSARSPRHRERLPDSLDTDGDKAVSRDEYRRVVDRVLAHIDADGDGTVSEAELAALRNEVRELKRIESAVRQSRRQEAKRRKLAEACGLPAASPNATIVLLGAQHGRALSSVGLGGDDVVVEVADVWIEAGSESLYVVLVSLRAMVWRLMGAVDRVETVVASAARRGPDRVLLAGIVGVDRARVHFPKRFDCLRFYTNPRGGAAAAARSNVTAFAGRAPDVVLHANGMSGVSLPGGIFDVAPAYRDARPLPKTGAGAPLWREARRQSPGGIVEIDPAQVVSLAKARPYKVLPRLAGLASLLDEGALEIIGTTKVVRFNGLEFVTSGGGDRIVLPPGKKAEVIRRPNEFLIVKKIRIPAGLSGGHAVKFQLAPGVPEPSGSPGHSCIRHQATGEPVAGSRCR